MDESGIAIGVLMGIICWCSFILGKYIGYKESMNQKIDRMYDSFYNLTELYREVYTEMEKRKENK